MTRETIFAASVAAAVGGLPSLVLGAPIARWDMDPTGGSQPAVLDSIAADGDNHLITFNDLGNTYPTSALVPPSSMFANGFGGGTNSFDSAAFAEIKAALFYPPDLYGQVFNFTGGFTVELFFKSDGDRQSEGPMTLFRQGELALRYDVVANVPQPGALTCTLYDGTKAVSAVLARRNYVDGLWHGLRFEYIDGSGGSPSLVLWATQEDGTGDRVSVAVAPDFGPLVDSDDGNFFIGRNTYPLDQAPETFIGLIDEVQVSGGAPAAGEQLVALPGNPSGPVIRWTMTPSGGVDPVSLDARTAPGEGALTGVGSPPLEEDHLWMIGSVSAIPTSGDVPPTSMFANGSEAGSHSFDAGALAGAEAALAFPAAVYGAEAAFTGPFSAELFFKSDGDQSASGVMQLLRQGELARRWELTLNEGDPGSVRFTVADAVGTLTSVSSSSRNYADGGWNYVFVTFDPGSSDAPLTMTLVPASGATESRVALLAPGFGALAPVGDGNVVVGRNRIPLAEAHRTFIGLIDEVQICSGIASEGELLGNGVPRPGEPKFWEVTLDRGSDYTQVTWNSQQHHLYDIFFSMDPSTDPWTCLETVSGRAGYTSYFDVDPSRVGGNRGFYRVGRR